MNEFLAIDFETANNRQDSACAIGIVRVAGGKIVHQECHLIRPPSRHFMFTYIHGLSWQDVAEAEDFAGIWAQIEKQFAGVDFITAHNAGFDRGVLNACCLTYGLDMPRLPYVCTVQLARQLWSLRPTKLPDVCRYLGLELDHHKADSDARACAQIVIAAQEDGWRYGSA